MDIRPSTILRIAQPLKSLAQRFTYLGLILMAFGVMLVGKIDAVVVDRMRAEVTDAVAPILVALSHPAQAVSDGVQELRTLADIRAENARLREENTRLLQWQAAARKLHAENLALQTLLERVPEALPRFVTARVIAGSGGALSNTMIINAGRRAGVRKGQAVLSDTGIVGRVAEVASRSSRVLLLTDINSRIPVLLEETRVRALMVGGNTSRPRLIHIPPGGAVSPSDRVVTSGHGGAFPPGLPVGSVASVTNQGIQVQLFADFDRLEFVRVADYGLPKILTGEE